MNRFFTLATALGGAGLALLALIDPALAQDAAAAPVPNKGDTAWMLVAAILVLMMVVPGLALFYGGLVRTKNMLSVLTQVFAIACLAGADLGHLRLFARLHERRRPQRLCGRLLEGVPGRASTPPRSRRPSRTAS